MAGLGPAIHVFSARKYFSQAKVVHARDKRGHDELVSPG
jgi:hypothetical protein